NLEDRNRSLVQLRTRQRQRHKQPRMAGEALLLKRLGRGPRLMSEQLCLDSMDARGLLQRLDHVREKAPLNMLAGVSLFPFPDEKNPKHAPFFFLNQKHKTQNTPPRYRRVTRQELRVHVAKDHLCRAAVIPAERARPQLDFVFQQRTQVCRRKMPEIENLHTAPARTRTAPELSLVALGGSGKR